jgi:hypothetical protein
MSLVAVEDAVQSLLNGQTTPYLDPAQAWVRPPTFVFLTTPQIFIWSGDWTDERHTIPRLMGQRRAIHQLTVWLQVATSSSGDIANGTAISFPYLIEGVLSTLRTIPIPIALTDPATGATSVLQSIGETFKVKHPVPMAANPQSDIIWQNATITVTTTEEYTG